MVEIRGGGTLDGAQLIDAASDSTLRELITTLTMQGNRDKADKAESMAKQVKGADIDAVTESYKKQTKQVDDTHESTRKLKDKLDDMAKSLGTVSATLASKGISSIFDFFNTGLDAFRNLSTIGAGFNGNLTELSTIALNAGKSVEGFAKTVAENQQSLVGLGGSAEGGARKLAEIGSMLTQGQLLQRFSGMAMGLKDIESASQAYLETQNRLGTLTRQNSSSLAENTTRYSESIDGVVRALGLSRDALQKNSVAVSNDPVWNQLLRNMKDQDAAGRALINISSLQAAAGKDASEAFKELAIKAPTGALALGLTQLGPAVGSLINQVNTGGKSLADNIGPIKRAIDDKLKGLDPLQIKYNDQLRALDEFRIAISGAEAAIKQEAADRNDPLLVARNSFGAALMNLTSTMGTAFNKFQGALASTEIFKSIETNLNKFAQYISSDQGIKAISEFATDLANAFKQVYSAVQQGYQQGGVWQAIVSGLNVIWDKVGEVVGSNLTKIFNQVFPGSIPNNEQTARANNQSLQDNNNQNTAQRQTWQQTFSENIAFLKKKGEEFFSSLPAALTSGIDSARSSLNSTFDDIKTFLDSLPARITRFANRINADIQSIDLSKFSTFASDVRSLSIQDLSDRFDRLPAAIDRVKNSITGFADLVKGEITKLNALFKPGAEGPESINNFSTALGRFEGPLMSLINKISGLEGQDAQTSTASNISNVLTSVTNFIDKTVQGIATLQNLNPERANAAIPIMQKLGVAVQSFLSELSLIQGGRPAALENFSSTVEAISRINNINSDNLNGVVTSMRSLQGIGNNLQADIQGVQAFSSNVSALADNLQRAASASQTLRDNAGSIPGGSPATGALGGATTTGGIGVNELYGALNRVENAVISLGGALATIASNTQRPVPAVTKSGR